MMSKNFNRLVESGLGTVPRIMFRGVNRMFYRGREYKVDPFDYGNMGTGLYLSSRMEIAKYYANMKTGNQPAVLWIKHNVENPILVEDKKSVIELSEFLGVQSVPVWDGYQQKNPNWSDEVSRLLVRRGHDGVFAVKEGELVSFYPEKAEIIETVIVDKK